MMYEDYFESNSLNFFYKVYVGLDNELIYGRIYEVCQIDTICYVVVDYDKMKIFPDWDFLAINEWRNKQIKNFLNEKSQ